MSMTFEETAKREWIWLRGFFMGPTGSGKSKGSLELASRLAEGKTPITLINTERGRGKLYADRYTYSLIDMSGDGGGDVDHSPESFVKAIDLAESRNPGGILILDSASHEWAGKNGVLQQADRFGDWKTVRPKHNDWVERLMAVQGHVIVCCRAKMKYEVSKEEKPGGGERQVITMLGVGPIQSDDLQYEFNLVGRFDQDTKEATFSGHVDPLQGTVHNLVDDGDAVAAQLMKWLSEGDPPAPPESATEEAIGELVESLKQEGHSRELIDTQFAAVKGKNRGVLPPDWVDRNLTMSKERIAATAPKAPEPAEEQKKA
jgi:hypothetical protein